jgi:hypothetical protein
MRLAHVTRFAAALLVLAAAAQPRSAAAADIDVEKYCTFVCAMYLQNCLGSNSLTYCSGAAAGCMTGCMAR